MKTTTMMMTMTIMMRLTKMRMGTMMPPKRRRVWIGMNWIKKQPQKTEGPIKEKIWTRKEREISEETNSIDQIIESRQITKDEDIKKKNIFNIIVMKFLF